MTCCKKRTNKKVRENYWRWVLLIQVQDIQDPCLICWIILLNKKNWMVTYWWESCHSVLWGGSWAAHTESRLRRSLHSPQGTASSQTCTPGNQGGTALAGCLSSPAWLSPHSFLKRLINGWRWNKTDRWGYYILQPQNQSRLRINWDKQVE